MKHKLWTLLVVFSFNALAFAGDNIIAPNWFKSSDGKSIVKLSAADNLDGTFTLNAATGGSAGIIVPNWFRADDGKTIAILAATDNGDGTYTLNVNGAGGGGGGAPTDARYVTTRSETGLSNEFSLGSLTSGLLKIGVSAGTATPATAISGTDYAPATSGSAMLKGNGSGGFSNATADTDYAAAPSQQTVGDANATWSAGKDVLIATAAMTANRAITMPAANSAVAGKIRTCVDKVTDPSSTFVRSFTAAGSDTINGSSSYALPAGPGSISFVTDGSSAWTVVYTASQPAFTDMRDKLVDSQSALSVKPSCTLVATSNLTLSGNQTVDGVTGTNGVTLVLATAQSTGSQNGPWIMQSGAWTRPSWYSSGSTAQAIQFMTTLIRLGTAFQGSVWRCTTANPITIDTTATTWSQTPYVISSTSVGGVGTGVVSALQTNVGSAGAFVTNGGAGGTPSSLTGTNITGTADGFTAGDVTRNHAVYSSASPPTVDVGSFIIAKTGVDLKTSGTTDIFTVPTGRKFTATSSTAVVTSVTSPGAGTETFKIIESGAGASLTTNTASGSGTPAVGTYYFETPTAGGGPWTACAAGNKVQVAVTTSQAGSTAVTGTVFVTGFYTQ